MAQFQPIVLKYLEHHLPDLYQQLKVEHQLRAYMDMLVDRLYEEAEHRERRLADEHPGENPERLAIYAEQMAIAAVLPTEPLPDLAAEFTEADEGIWHLVKN